MKITVCDVCRTEGKKLVETKKYFSLRHTKCRLDVCTDHEAKVKALNNIDFVKLSYLADGLTISDDDAKLILRRK